MKPTLFAILTLTCGTAFGGTIVVPNAYTSTETFVDAASFFNNSAEYLWAGSQFGSVGVGSQLTALGFRLGANQNTGPTSPMDFTSFSVTLSTSLVPLGSLTSVFANNMGPDAVTVINGPLTVPANAFTGGTGPNPFVFFPFSTPYTYEGGDLLVTLTWAGGNPSGSSYLDLEAVATGGVVDTAEAASYGGYVHYFNAPVEAFQFTQVPEPSALLLTGCLALCLARLRPAKSHAQR